MLDRHNGFQCSADDMHKLHMKGASAAGAAGGATLHPGGRCWPVAIYRFMQLVLPIHAHIPYHTYPIPPYPLHIL